MVVPSSENRAQRPLNGETGTGGQGPRAGVPTQPPTDRGNGDLVYRRLIEEHRAQLRDDAWARGAESSFGRELEALGVDGGFDIRSLRCQSSSCLAEVGWNTQEDVEASADALMRNEYALNCERYLQKPADCSADCTGSVLFRCPRGGEAAMQR